MPLKKAALLLLFGSMLSSGMYSQTLYLSAKGETENETKVIDSLYYQKSFSDFASIQQEVYYIKDRLTNFGYLESELIALKKQNDSSYVAEFFLNHRYKSIRLYFDSSINKDILKKASKDVHDTYFDIEIENLEHVLKQLNSEFSNQGDPFSTLRLSNIKKLNKDQLYANLVLSEQAQKRTIDSIIIKGYEKFPKSYLKHYLKIKRHQPFNLKTTKDKMSELQNLVFASQIKDPEVLFTRDSTLLYIYVEKKKSNGFDGYLGFGTNEATHKLEFNGYLNLNLTNNLNYGESLKILYKSARGEQKTFDVKARLPYLFGSPLGTELSLNIFRKDSTFVTVAQTAKLGYQINPKNLVSVGINSITSTNLLDNSITFVDDYKSTFYTLDYLYTKKQGNDELFPINFEFDLATGFGTRTVESSKVPQSKLYLNTFKIFNLNAKNSIYIKVSGATILSESYLENELYRFGGINSIRGFEENSLLANLFSVLNTEYRYRISNGLYVHSVLDAAYFENKLLRAKEKLFGFGFGLGLITKSGLFKLNYACGKTENNVFRLSNSKVHLSLTASF